MCYIAYFKKNGVPDKLSLVENKKSILSPIFFIALILSLIIKVLSVWGNNFPITYDQGRDLIDLRRMQVTHIPRLVGPTTSINGVLLGPFYDYLIFPPYIISGGNPAAIVYWQIILYQVSVLILWLVLRKKDQNVANISGILLSLLPTGFYTARYFWNANFMPIFTIFFLATIFYALEKQNTARSFLLGLVSGLSLQIEAAFGILFFPFALLLLLVKRFSPKKIFALIIGFSITLLPQAGFELRHGFIMTNTLLTEFTGKAAVLGAKLTFSERLPERELNFINTLRDTNHIPFEILSVILAILFITGLIFLFKKNKSKNISKDTLIISLSLFLFFCIFYLLFPMQVKRWYILGLTSIAVLYLSSVLAGIFSRNIFGKILVYLFLIFTFTNTIKAHTEYIDSHFLKPSDDPSNLSNMLKNIDTVYQNANGQSFKIYSFVPAIYDYGYQYLFWWHGTKKYGYQPADISYLPGVPEYIENNQIYWTKKKESLPITTYLLVQHDPSTTKQEKGWRNNFKNNSIVIQNYYWNTSVEKITD